MLVEHRGLRHRFFIKVHSAVKSGINHEQFGMHSS